MGVINLNSRVMTMVLYDPTKPESIEAYGKKMIGRTFREIAEKPVEEQLIKETTSIEYATKHANTNYKGGLGNLVEECWFGYKANSNPEADFDKAGVELKVTPYKETRKNKSNPTGYVAKERLVLTMINYMDIVKEQDFGHSHVWEKAKLMLLVWYLHMKQHNDIDSTIDFVQLFTPPKEDLEIIKEDYEKILSKIRAGKAHEISEGDTLYLGACTKAATSKDRRQQPFSDIEAKPRAFSLKNKYMTYVLTHYIMPGKTTYEPVVKADEQVSDFEKYVVSKIDSFKGKTLDELCQHFDIKTRPKDLPAMIAFRILGVKGNQCEEFVKAGIAVKAIRIGKNGKIRENMSFPAFNYQTLAEETWEDSTFGNYLRETRFFFVIYKEDQQGKLHLDGSMFWNMPLEDIEGDVKDVWQETHDIVAQGRITINVDEYGRLINNFPKKKDHLISHVRPHAQTMKDVYPLPEGTSLKFINRPDVWPDKTRYIKHCFWLNNDYILKQIQEHEK